ncbi:MAG TPA: HlyD family secretion protein, partial [Ferruginibacter sp.]|nr:HlyD family secretion protein [Ferruginibacter sp.]
MTKHHAHPPKPKRKKIIFPIILGLVLIGALIFSIREYLYYRTHEETDNAQIDADISPVISRVAGYVKEIRFTDNQLVHAGDTLVVLDDRDFQIRLQQAEAALMATEKSVNVASAAVQEARAGRSTIQANIDAANVRVWKTTEDFNRYQNLYNEHAITKAQFDAAKAEKESAEAALAAVKSQTPVLNSRVNTGETQTTATASNVALKQADLDYPKLQLSYTVITAPADGIISKRNIQIGQLVQAGQSLVAVVNDHHVYVTANFKETQMQHLKVGEKVDLTVDAYPDKKIAGRVES